MCKIIVSSIKYVENFHTKFKDRKMQKLIDVSD